MKSTYNSHYCDFGVLFSFHCFILRGFTYDGVLALMSSAQLCVSRVLDIENPAANQDGEPGEEQVLHPHEGDPSLERRTRDAESSFKSRQSSAFKQIIVYMYIYIQFFFSLFFSRFIKKHLHVV